jgi:hypothetical protein
MFANFDVALLLESEIQDHRLHFYHPILKYSSVSEVSADGLHDEDYPELW